MTDNELELIDVQGNSLLMDGFLPDKPMAVGDTWKPSEKLMAEFLGLDEVGQTDVQSTLKEVTDSVARFEMAGNVAGAAEGVSTAIEIKARYRYDLNRKRIDWLGMVVREQRNRSPVAFGIDVGAQLQMTIFPAEKSEGFDEAELKNLPTQASADLMRLSLVSKQGRWEITHDRSWHVYRDQEGISVLRRIEQGELIAQCNLSSLPQGKPDKLVSLEEFQEDVTRALGKEFKEFVEAGQSADESNRRVLRVVARERPRIYPFYGRTTMWPTSKGGKWD